MRILNILTCSLFLLTTACSSQNDPVTLTPEEIGNQDDSIPLDGNGDNSDTLDPSFNIHAPAFELIYDLAAYKPDQLAGVVPDLAQIVISTAIGSPEVLDNGEFVTPDSRFDEVTTETDRVRYQCSGGGTLLHETGAMRLDDISYTHIRGINKYTFDQCLFDVTTDRVAAGNYSANGVLYTSERNRSGSRFGEGAGILEWTAFELIAPDSLQYEVEGSSTWNSTSSTGNSYRSRQSDISYYRKTQELDIINEMTNGKFEMNVNFDGGNSMNTLEMQLGGSFEDSRGNGRVITVNTIIPFSLSAGLSEEQSTPEGQLSVLSSDGGSITLIASGSDDRLDPSKNPLVDWTSTSADGRVASATGVSLGNYTTTVARCIIPNNVAPLICADGSYAYSLP